MHFLEYLHNLVIIKIFRIHRSKTVPVQVYFLYLGAFYKHIIFCTEEIWEHVSCTASSVITSYGQIASCGAGTSFRSRASESQDNSATCYYAECPNH